MFCPNCGQQNADNATFCCNCGAPIAQQQTTYQQAPSNPQNTTQSHVKKSKFSLMIIICAIVMAVSVFLPLVTATGAVAEAIDRAPNQKVYQGLDYTASDLKSPSMFNFIQIYLDMKDYAEDSDRSINTGFEKNIYFTIIYAASALVAAWFAYKCDSTKILIFIIISMFFKFLILGDMDDSGMLNMDTYTYGIGVYVFLVASITAIVGAVKIRKELGQSKKKNAQV